MYSHFPAILALDPLIIAILVVLHVPFILQLTHKHFRTAIALILQILLGRVHLELVLVLGIFIPETTKTHLAPESDRIFKRLHVLQQSLSRIEPIAAASYDRFAFMLRPVVAKHFPERTERDPAGNALELHMFQHQFVLSLAFLAPFFHFGFFLQLFFGLSKHAGFQL